MVYLEAMLQQLKEAFRVLRSFLNSSTYLRRNLLVSTRFTRLKIATPPVRGFWQNIIDEKLLKGETITVVAPMADVTDIAFRTMISKYSKPYGPDVMWTEFVSADGLNSPGREVLKRDLEFTDIERPIVAQLFTSNPENMRKASALCKELGFDGIDINMGCPAGTIVEQGAGADLIKNPQLAQALIRAAQDGAQGLPVSVKTRIGYNKIEFMEWLPKILECNVPTLTVHLRTKKEMSKVDAHWEVMPDIVKLVRDMTGEVKDGGTIILGNGDVKSVTEGKKLARETGCDGVMIGRGMFGTPWFFNSDLADQMQTSQTNPDTITKRLKILVEHTKLYEEKLGDIKSFAIMKKHFKAYVNGFDGAKELRVELMECSSSVEVEQKITMFLSKSIT